jgi:hypothetical protein
LIKYITFYCEGGRKKCEGLEEIVSRVHTEASFYFLFRMDFEIEFSELSMARQTIFVAREAFWDLYKLNVNN